MQLSEHKTYRTRDGSRTGIRVERRTADTYTWKQVGIAVTADTVWTDEGNYLSSMWPHKFDLIEEEHRHLVHDGADYKNADDILAPTTPAFSYDACPVGPDGRRRAVTEDGSPVVLLTNEGPSLRRPIIGWFSGTEVVRSWSIDGKFAEEGLSRWNLLVPPPPSKPVIWVVLTDFVDTGRLLEPWAIVFRTEEEASRYQGRSIGRPQPYEVDDATSPFVMGGAS